MNDSYRSGTSRAGLMRLEIELRKRRGLGSMKIRSAQRRGEVATGSSAHPTSYGGATMFVLQRRRSWSASAIQIHDVHPGQLSSMPRFADPGIVPAATP